MADQTQTTSRNDAQGMQKNEHLQGSAPQRDPQQEQSQAVQQQAHDNSSAATQRPTALRRYGDTVSMMQEISKSDG